MGQGLGVHRLAHQEHPGHLIKRVIGMPGDKVVCCTKKGRITVNGYPLDESSYLYTDPDGDQVNPLISSSRWWFPRTGSSSWVITAT